MAPNMMLAKVCSDKNKPNGQYKIPSTRRAVLEFIKDLPIRKVCTVMIVCLIAVFMYQMERMIKLWETVG
jgi:nucleotidyltransferase/DNA polymerase involved in DNA repair